MNTFKEFQFATIIFILSIPAQLFINIMFLTQAGTHSPSLNSLIILNVVFAILYLLFYSMTTTIDNGVIRIRYGIGLIRKTIKLEDVKSISVVSNPWYYGWGIRFIPNGMLYNISGLSGIELTFNNSSRVIRIGSSNAILLRDRILSGQ